VVSFFQGRTKITNEDIVLRKICKTERAEVSKQFRLLHEEPCDLYKPANIGRTLKSRRLQWLEI
jgi:hypothetical protein